MELRSYPFVVMGGPAQILLYAADEATARHAAGAAIAETRRLEARYSRFRPDSLLSAINAQAKLGADALLDPETCSLIDVGFAWRRRSGGRFDITSGLLRQAWDFDAGHAPEPQDLEPLLARIGMDKLVWEPPRLAFATTGIELDLGGVVKEYAADRAALACARAGAPHALVELAGDIAVAGPQASGAPWPVGVRHPRRPEQPIAVVELAQGGLASSGDYERWFEADGVRYCHILDARTGWPAQGLAAATVVAESCLAAGGLATTAMLMGRDAPAWLAQEAASHLWIDAEGRAGGTLPLSAPLDWPG
jgi:thiamine biosynthesis lipoprotein